MAEYLANATQLVELNQPIDFTASIPCGNGYVIHEDETGIFILRGATPNCFARYQVTFNGNIAVPSTGTVGPIAVSLALDGEPILTSRAIVTPADVAAEPPTTENFFNVTSTAIISVPKGCCFNISVENVSESADPATTPAPAILVQNANLTVSRIA